MKLFWYKIWIILWSKNHLLLLMGVFDWETSIYFCPLFVHFRTQGNTLTYSALWYVPIERSFCRNMEREKCCKVRRHQIRERAFLSGCLMASNQVYYSINKVTLGREKSQKLASRKVLMRHRIKSWSSG